MGTILFSFTSILDSDSGHTGTQMDVLADKRKQEQVACGQ